MLRGLFVPTQCQVALESRLDSCFILISFLCLLKTIYGQHRQVDKVVMLRLTIKSNNHRMRL